ncbi:hypothetical protein SLL00_05505 [Metabacillus indicus]|uniref:glucosamine inositolphosphorylceramide transferase family protein n=1 Tax=Metabacillus indicus TaxID=246786 RepID=UPI002A0479C1|nr:hypothetical protein [Metabacillus indicus]MDX8289236.1 hypothetical protein [Metabacillus indicus]
MGEINSKAFAVVTASSKVEKWKIDCINELIKNQAELKLIIIPQKTQDTGKNAADIRDTHREVPVQTIDCTDKIQAMNLDFILDFDGTHLHSFENTCKYGVWTFLIGDAQLNQHIGFWEITNNQPVTPVRMVMASEPDNITILKQGYFPTQKHSLSKNRDQIFSSIYTWPSIMSKALPMDDMSEKAADCSANYKAPDLFDWIKLNRRLFKNNIARLFNQLFCYEYWNVGLINLPIEKLLDEDEFSIRWLGKHRNVYYADPFGIEINGSIQVLMEELDYREVKGYISEMNIEDVSEPKVNVNSSILRLPSHMSYPYLLNDNGRLLCIPETSEEKKTMIYSFDSKTNRWNMESVIMSDFSAVDSTVIRYENKWWLFCTRGDEKTQSHNSELHIYYSDDLFGKWKPHRQNPVKIDIRSARPAGTPFVSEGILYRPSQDCSQTYGGRIVLNKITKLSESHFDEETISSVDPRKNDLYKDGVHTLSAVNAEWTLIDGKRFDYSFFHFLKKLYRYYPAGSQKSSI